MNEETSPDPQDCYEKISISAAIIEETVDTTLDKEPKCDSNLISNDGDCDKKSTKLRPILKTTHNKAKHQTVKFADDSNEILVSYDGTSNAQHWTGVKKHTTSEVLEHYYAACHSVHTVVQDAILVQLGEIRDNTDYSATLNLTDVTIDIDVVQTLEAIFKMATFHTIHLGKCAVVPAMEIFSMFEFYDPVVEIILSEFPKDDVVMWHYFGSAAAVSKSLTSVAFRDMFIGNQSLHAIFQDGINTNEKLSLLRFDGCALSRAPTFMLVNNLEYNQYISELHLCYLDLFSKEAEILGRFLNDNTSLRILDISNNNIGDHGLEVLSKGLCQQASKGRGIEVLIVCNNKLTKKCGAALSGIVSACQFLHTINVGLNNLTDEVISDMQLAIVEKKWLQALGLQSTLLTCHGIISLIDICVKNNFLYHLNLRGNKAIQPVSLNNLADVIPRTSLTQIDLDDNNRSCNDPQKYVEIVNKIRHLININKNKIEKELPNQQPKVNQEFLNCEPVYVPKKIMQSTEHTLQNRFSVERVAEATVSSRTTSSSRFTVTRIGSDRPCTSKAERVLPQVSPQSSEDVCVPRNNEVALQNDSECDSVACASYSNESNLECHESLVVQLHISEDSSAGHFTEPIPEPLVRITLSDSEDKVAEDICK